MDNTIEILQFVGVLIIVQWIIAIIVKGIRQSILFSNKKFKERKLKVNSTIIVFIVALIFSSLFEIDNIQLAILGGVVSGLLYGTYDEI